MIGRFTRVFDYINHWADKTPKHTALVNRDYKISYCELRLQAISFAAFLLEAGLTKGDYIAYQIPPMREFFYMYLGASIIGVTVIGINDRAPVLEVEEIVTQYHPQIVFVNSDIRVLQMKKAINIPVINLTKIPDHRLISYGQLKAVEHAEKRISGDEIVFIILSSGSTGKPKAVCISHTNIITSALAQMREFGAPKSSCMDDVYLHYFPVNHVSGAIEWGFAPLVSGSTIVICDKFDPALALQMVGEFRVSILAGVPTMWKKIFSNADLCKSDLSSIRWCATGGMPSDEVTIKRILDICGRCSNPLGLTETSGFCSFFNGESDIKRLTHTIGHIIPELQYKILRADSKECENGEIGHLCYRGQSVATRYLSAQMPIDDDGYFDSGDLASKSSDGYIYFWGRSDDMFITGGYNVYPTEIEQVMMNYPGVNAAIVFPVQHSTMGAVPQALVVPENSRTREFDVSGLTKYLEDRLIYYKIPRRIEIVDSLPMTTIGKIARITRKKDKRFK